MREYLEINFLFSERDFFWLKPRSTRDFCSLQQPALALTHSCALLLVCTQLHLALRSRNSENVVDGAPHELAHKIRLLLGVGDGVQRHVDEHAVAALA